MQITRIKLSHWRNFKNVEVRLGRRSFFVGPNASGKSNLLDSLRFLRDIVSDGGGLQPAILRRGGVKEIRSFAATRNSIVSVEIDIGDGEQPSEWTYHLSFKTSTGQREPIVEKETVKKRGKTILERPAQDEKSDAALRTQTSIEQVSANREFRDVAEFLKTIRYLHVVPQIVREPARSVGKDDPFGGDLIERINSTPARSRNSRLKRMEEALKIAVPQLDNLELEIDERGIPHLRAKYAHWRTHGAWQRESQFSDGTLRLLGLIWSLQEQGGPILFEEPELSLNPAVVSKLAPMIARAGRRSSRQSVITTHSAELLSNGVSLDEIFLLENTSQGTSVRQASDIREVAILVAGGMPAGEAVLPKTRAPSIDRLTQLELAL